MNLACAASLRLVAPPHAKQRTSTTVLRDPGTTQPRHFGQRERVAQLRTRSRPRAG